MSLRLSFLMGAALLLACAPAGTSAHEETPAKTADWIQSPQALIAARDHREFLVLVDGTYDNQEQVYFEDNLEFDERDRHPRLGFTIRTQDSESVEIKGSKLSFEKRAVSLEYTDGKGTAAGTFSLGPGGTQLKIGECTLTFTRSFEQFIGRGDSACAGAHMAWSSEGVDIKNLPKTIGDGVYRRAHSFKCWVSPQKEDGTYGFYNDVVLHDQGGRAWVEGEGHPRVGIRMRNVVWPTGNNRPSLVLYAYKGEDEDKAVSYAWTSPAEPRIGLNLRWMQVSCTRGEGVYTPNINLKTGAGSGK